MIKIVIDDMRARGKNGFVAKIDIENGCEKKFLKEACTTGYGTSCNQKTYLIEEDGVYQINDANFGGKAKTNFIQVKDGEIVAEDETLNKIIIGTCQTDDTDYPELEGSDKQIAWANSIRNDFIAKCIVIGRKIPDRVKQENQAKFFIDHKDKLKSYSEK